MSDLERLARAMCAEEGLDWEAQASFTTSAGGDDNEQERYYGLARALLRELRNPSEAMVARIPPVYREEDAAAFTAMIDAVLGEERE